MSLTLRYTTVHNGHYTPLWMVCVLLLCHYHQSSSWTSSLMKHVDICYSNFHINAALIPWALSLWLRESAHIFLWTWTKPGDQNHKISCGCGKHRWKPEEELKSRQINSFTRKGRHHISDSAQFYELPKYVQQLHAVEMLNKYNLSLGSQGWLCWQREPKCSNCLTFEEKVFPLGFNW